MQCRQRGKPPRPPPADRGLPFIENQTVFQRSSHEQHASSAVSSILHYLLLSNKPIHLCRQQSESTIAQVEAIVRGKGLSCLPGGRVIRAKNRGGVRLVVPLP